MNGIHIEDLCKTYRSADTAAVDGLTLHIGEKEIFGLLGPNGAGKTTTLSILAGLIRQDSGTILYHNGNERIEMRNMRKRMGVVPQNIALYPTLTAVENLRFFGSMYGIDRHELNERIEHHLKLLGLDRHAGKQVKNFSGGMKRRLNLLAGLMHRPDILLLDEPTAGVDVQSRHVILEFLQQLRSKGATIVYTSHYLDEAERLCDHIDIIDRGTSVTAGSPQDLLRAHSDCGDLYDLFLKLTGRELRD